MAPSSPQMRATWMKLALSQAKRLPDADRVRQAVPAATWDAIRSATVVGWLPAHEFAELASSFVVALGEVGARALWRDTLLHGFDRPLLRPLVEGALAIYGRSPASILKMSPRAWGLVAQRAGTLEVEQLDERTYTVAFHDIPPELRRSGALMSVLLGNCDAVLRRFDVNGRVREESAALASRGEVTLTVSWWNASVPPPPPAPAT